MDSRHGMNLGKLKNSDALPPTLFLDDGGVLNDNRLRAPEWRRLIGEFMPGRMGGTAERWTMANRMVFPRVWDDLQKRMPRFASHQEFQRAYAVGWMGGMCAYLCIAPPPDSEAVALHRELSIYVAERADSAIAGAASAIHSLHRAGYTLYMASGTPSWELRGILTNMGIAEVLSGLYGPDLVDHVKHGSAFYRNIFGHAGVAPSSALVIESDSVCCRWASEAGARAVWIDPGGRGYATTLEAVAQALV